MRALYVDPVGGAAGDMLLAALLDLGAPLDGVKEALASLPLPTGCFDLVVDQVTVGGFKARRVRVSVQADPAHHRTLADVLALIDGARLAPRVRERATTVFRRLAAAEARVHAVAADAVHFHEVGAVDAVVDIVGCAVALELLEVGTLTFGSLAPGSGIIESAHGPLPLPAPATLELLSGIPIRLGGPPGEWVTPTAAAILVALGAPVPPEFSFRPERVGIGAGHRPRRDRPNIVRVMLGDPAGHPCDFHREIGGGLVEHETVVMIEAAVDDQPPTALALAAEHLRAAGALDVYLMPVLMKKGRAGTLLTVLARPEAAESLARRLLRETTTLGLRLRREERRTLVRRLVSVDTPYGPIRVKETLRPGGEVEGSAFRDATPETDDVARAARERGVPFAMVARAARTAWESMIRDPMSPGDQPAG